MRIDDAVNAVREFHRAVSAPIAETPTLLLSDSDRTRDIAMRIASLATAAMTEATDIGGVLLPRAAMALEELAEWLFAHAADDLVAVADAWADRAYVLIGDAVAAGLPAAELFDEVHRSNMTKDADPGSTGKAVKGTRYSPPNLEPILSRAKSTK